MRGLLSGAVKSMQRKMLVWVYRLASARVDLRPCMQEKVCPGLFGAYGRKDSEEMKSVQQQ